MEGDFTREEMVYGVLICSGCKTRFPIFEGVALIVPEVNEYILSHAKGISKFVADAHIPKEILKMYRKIRDEKLEEHIEEDLESDRVNALYLMNHYLTSADIRVIESPYLKKLISEYWDHGPMEWIASQIPNGKSVLELGCGVGGLAHRVKSKSYLGIDGSFQSIMLARHFNLGVPYRGKLNIPGDLLKGALEEPFPLSPDRRVYSLEGDCDFVVGDLDVVPIKDQSFDTTVAMNAIDMMEDPRQLPLAQKKATKKNGLVIQCAPYIWAARVSARIRKMVPREFCESAKAIEWIYENEGLKIERSEKSIPWLFYKHSRQIELYDVHAFTAKV